MTKNRDKIVKCKKKTYYIFAINAHPWLTLQHSWWQYCSLAPVVTRYKTEKKTMKQRVATSVTKSQPMTGESKDTAWTTLFFLYSFMRFMLTLSLPYTRIISDYLPKVYS